MLGISVKKSSRIPVNACARIESFLKGIAF